jgi:two-component system cell cycle sensor histidine kinase/response regulator CckA
MILQQKEQLQGGTSSRSSEKCPMSESAAGQLRVLIMDDDDITRSVISLMLEQAGCRVGEAADGEKAISYFKMARDTEEPFDVVLLDLTVPNGMGGREAMLKLAEIDPAVKAVIVTGNTVSPAFSDYRAFGFRGALAKPFSGESLLAALREAVASPDCP